MPDTLIQIVDAALASAVERAASHLACRPGCTQCCIGIFAISQQDAHRLHTALTSLDHTDPTRATHIRIRVAASLTRLTPHLPADPATGILDEDYESTPFFADEPDDSDEEGPEVFLDPNEHIDANEQAAIALGNNEPCPVLDPATGTCDLYAARPIVCRTFGPPSRTPDDDLVTCELCFTSATTDETAAAELDPTLPALEAASNAAFNAAHHLHGETTVALALRFFLNT